MTEEYKETFQHLTADERQELAYKTFDELTKDQKIQLALEEIDWVVIGGQDGDYYYRSFEEAQKAVCDYLRGPVVEYLSVDCGENK